MSESQVQNENIEPTKKVTKPRKPRAEASSSKSSAPKKSSPKKSSSSQASTPKKSSPKKSNSVVVEKSSKAEASSKSTEKTIEEVYQKKTQLEHVLLRPDTYVGSIEPQKDKMWVYDSEKQRMVYRDITYVPGLYKIVDEILVNAADNKVRDPKMNTIKVNINEEEGSISIYNNGKGIPIEIHKEEEVWVPELIFGHLLTSSNYDDSEKKVTGGRNGYGAKLANIFSTEFIVETTDSSVCKKYRQIFKNNMSIIEEPELTKYNKKEEYTMITFKPDFGKFNMSQFDDDIVALLKKRVYDMVACVNNIKVYLNNELLKLKNFKEYMQLYLDEQEEPRPAIVYERVNDRWEIGALPSSESQFQQISFVNSICTSKGGTHVNYIADQLADRILSAVKSKKKDANIKKNQVKNHIWIFVKCLIENPTFDSQTKENLTLKVSSFGSSCNPSDSFFKELLKCGIVDQIIEVVDFKLNKELKKTDGKKSRKITGITKLDDANFAGGRNAKDCTLILTEGDSAKSLAVAGLSEVGRDYYGVFPLRGKLLNVRDGSHKQIMNNAEIQHIKQILGLKQGKEYESTGELRYGHLMIMTDQDHDGSHIKGLIINFMDHFFPSLLRIKGFLLEFITPIVKCTRGEMERSFFTVPEFERWRETIPDIKNWKIKYYKGLGTSSSIEAKKYFRNLNRHKKPFKPIVESERELIDMAFNKKKADDRKEWLKNYEPGTYMNHDVNEITITDFINKELILFSRADNERSIPNVLDGLKPGQRKVLYTCFKKNFKNEIKVSSLSGAVLAEAAYHHGDVSLQGTIIAMAHDFVGSNNINLLHGEGQFGTRAQGGKDAASARYISVTMPALTRKIFHPQDDALLTYCNDDGQFVEPEWYLPILPMILINGSEGIGTGWSSYIPNYNPRDIVDNLKRLINNEEPIPMHPWYRGFQGEFEQMSNGRYQVNGIIQKVNDESVRITELPIRVWTQNYKEQLEKWITGTERTSSWIREYKENHTTTTVDFTVKLSEENLGGALKEGLEKKFKISTAINTSNMVCFDGRGRIKRYNSAEEILKEFYDYRIEYYHKRKAHMIRILEIEVSKLRNKAKFLQMKIDHNLEFEGLSRNAIIDLLEKNNFERFTDDKDAKDVNDDEDFTISHNDHGYDYLMKSSAWSFCMEEVQKLLNRKAEKENELEDLREKTPQRMWIEDLDDFVELWDDILKQKQYRTKQVQVKLAEIPPKSSKLSLPSDNLSLFNAESAELNDDDDQNEIKSLSPTQDDDEMVIDSVDDNKNKKSARDKGKNKVLDNDKKQTQGNKGRKNVIDDYFATVEGSAEVNDDGDQNEIKSHSPTLGDDEMVIDSVDDNKNKKSARGKGKNKVLDNEESAEVNDYDEDQNEIKPHSLAQDDDEVVIDSIDSDNKNKKPARGKGKNKVLDNDKKQTQGNKGRKNVINNYFTPVEQSRTKKNEEIKPASQNEKSESVDLVSDAEETAKADKDQDLESARSSKRGRRKTTKAKISQNDEEKSELMVPVSDAEETSKTDKNQDLEVTRPSKRGRGRSTKAKIVQNDEEKSELVHLVSDTEETTKTDKDQDLEVIKSPKRGRRKTTKAKITLNDEEKSELMDPVSDAEETTKPDKDQDLEVIKSPKRGRRKTTKAKITQNDEEKSELVDLVSDTEETSKADKDHDLEATRPSKRGRGRPTKVKIAQDDEERSELVDLVTDTEETSKADKEQDLEVTKPPKRGRGKAAKAKITQNDEEKSELVDLVSDTEETSKTNKDQDQEVTNSPKRGRRKAAKAQNDLVFDMEEIIKTDQGQDQEVARSPKRGRRKITEEIADNGPSSKELETTRPQKRSKRKIAQEIVKTDNDTSSEELETTRPQKRGRRKITEETTKTDKDPNSIESAKPKNNKRKNMTLNSDSENEEVSSLNENLTPGRGKRAKRKAIDHNPRTVKRPQRSKSKKP